MGIYKCSIYRFIGLHSLVKHIFNSLHDYPKWPSGSILGDAQTSGGAWLIPDQFINIRHENAGNPMLFVCRCARWL
jgi:hypothetical protein